MKEILHIDISARISPALYEPWTNVESHMCKRLDRINFAPASELIGAMDRRRKSSLEVPGMPRSRSLKEWRARRKRGGNAQQEARADTLESEISLGQVTSLIKPNLGDWGRRAARSEPSLRSQCRPDTNRISEDILLRLSLRVMSRLIGGTLINGLRWGMPFLTKVKKRRRPVTRPTDWCCTVGAFSTRIARTGENCQSGTRITVARLYDKWVRYS